MRFVRAIALAVTSVACGDNVPRDVPFDATSGTRLRVERYLFDDGTTLPSGEGFFDAELHVRCTPQTWIDGVVRCVPEADEALFTDAACTTAVGRAMAITKPRYFIAHDVVEGASLPSRIFRATNSTISSPGQYYQRIDGTCSGPFFASIDFAYYMLEGEVSPPVEISETEVGIGRLAMRVRTSSDGASVPLAVFDRDFAVDCEPSLRGDGAVCEPTSAPVASLFADAACQQPAVAVAGTTTPSVARLEHDDGDCPTFHSLVGELPGVIYRLDRGSCIATARQPSLRYYLLGAEAALAPVERTVEDAHRRLQRIAIDTGEFSTYAHTLVDTALGDECARTRLGELDRCVPRSTIVALALYAQGCVQQLRVTTVPVRACHPPAFAITFHEAYAISAIGDATSEIVYRPAADGSCKPYVPPIDQQLRTLGPPLPDDTFLAARPFGVR
jgi:hypothetical protein